MLLGCVGADAHVDDLQKRQCFSPEEAVGHQWRSLDALGLCRSRCTCRRSPEEAVFLPRGGCRSSVEESGCSWVV